MGSDIFSDWMRVDLHIHTDFSRKTKENDYKGDFSVDLLSRQLRKHGVGVFSLTDHNIINVGAYQEYYSAKLASDPLLLLGVELDIIVDGLDKKPRGYHSLLIFNIFDLGGVERISGILEKAYSDYGITNPLQRKLDIEQIAKIFPDEDFFFIPHAGTSKSIVASYEDQLENAQRMVLLMQSAFEKVPEKTRQKYNSGFNRILETDFRSRGDIAYIDFSDNHNIAKYPCTGHGTDNVLHEFCYIKGKRSYESLRLAFIDPQSRIKTEREYQAIPKGLNTILGLRIPAHDSMAESLISFSPHLNVIIGGRSSGKSLLMYLLGEKTGAGSKGLESNYSEVVNLDQVKIKAKLDEDYKQSTGISPQYIYINQGDIVRYFERRELNSLAKKSGKSEEYQAAKDVLAKHQEDFTATSRAYTNSYRNALDAGRKKFILHRVTIEQLFSESYIFTIDGEQLDERFGIAASLLESQQLVARIDQDIGSLLKDKNLEFTDEQLQVVVAFQQLLTLKAGQLVAKNDLTTRRLKFIDLCCVLVSDLNNAQSEEAQAKKRAQEAREALVRESAAYLQILKSLEMKSSGLEQFQYRSTGKVALSEEIDLVIEVPDMGSIKEAILEGIASPLTKLTLYENTLRLLWGKVMLKNFVTNQATDLEKKVTTLLGPIVRGIEKPEDFLDYKNGETSKNRSPGFNSEKYLQIALQNPKTELIFIDQPEDNLGNRFIADYLVTIIRTIKFSKQIFLVTHNPSIVVYGDAESVIVAQNSDQVISFSQLVLEDEEAQRTICGILDGGEYVFDNRSRKYNIKRLIREGMKNGNG